MAKLSTTLIVGGIAAVAASIATAYYIMHKAKTQLKTDEGNKTQQASGEETAKGARSWRIPVVNIRK